MSGLLGSEKYRLDSAVEGESLLPTLLALLSTREKSAESGSREMLSSDSALENTFYSTPFDIRHPFTPIQTRTRSDLEDTTLNPLASPFSSTFPKGAHRGTGPEQLLGLHKRLTRTASDPVKLREGAKSWKSDDTSSESGIKDTTAARYKTELCRQFDESGLCKYGEKCQFAHGKGELRRPSRHPKYKTDKCRTYHTTGYCPYGIRCHFVHEDDEAVDSVAKKQQLGKQQEINDDYLDGRLQSILLEQQVEQLLEQQRLQQQQQRKNELFVAALTQATQRRYSSQLVDRSLSHHSSNPLSSSPRFSSSTLPHRPSLYDSIGSLARSSSPSSISESPASSPTHSMFDGLRVGEETSIPSIPSVFDSFSSGVEPAPAQLAPGYGRSTSVFHSPDPATSHARNSPGFPKNSDILGSFGSANILDVKSVTECQERDLDVEAPIASLNDAMLDDVISVLQDLVFRRVKQMTEGSPIAGGIYEERAIPPPFSLHSLTGVM